MSKNYRKMKEEGRLRGWILLRYAMPLITAVLCLLLMALPVLQFTNNQTGADEPISAFTLMKNSWDQVRVYLYGTADQTNGNVIFSQTVLISLIAFWILFAIGLAVSVWALFAAVRYTEEGCEENLGRIWFVTLIPNRTVLCVLTSLVIPLTAFARILPVFYRRIVYVAVELRVYGIDPMIAALVLTAFTVILSAVTAQHEKRMGLDPFRRMKIKEDPVEEEPEQETKEPRYMSESERRYYEAEQKTRKEQADRIAALFRVNAQDDKEENNDT